MIYVSSSCVKHKKIKDSVLDLVRNGFKNIELSGGTEYYEGFDKDLLELQDKHNLNYLCHNYFPPPTEHFVLNLASLNDTIYNNSFEHIKKSIELSQKLGADKFGFHAGFFIDIKVSEIGKKISKEALYNTDEAVHRFCQAIKKLSIIAEDIKLYIENNVFSSTNYKTYQGENFFMLTNSNDFYKLKDEINFNLLLDVAHLKVSAHTLNLNFEDELSHMIKYSDYIHISDNDGLHDLNRPLTIDSNLVNLLKTSDLKNKDFTLEIYDKMDKIKETHEILQKVIQ